MENKVKKNQIADNGKYSYQYVDIAQIHEYLAENNMSYYQYIDRIDNDDYIMTVKIINGEERPALRGSRVVDATLYGNDNPAQKQGSALTYARRYSLLMAFGLATEDDDANSLNKEITLEEAKNYVLTFGKNEGKKLSECDKGYINWLNNNTKDTKIIKMIELLTEQKKPTEEELDNRNWLLASIQTLELQHNIDHSKALDHYGVDSDTELSIEQLKDYEKRLKEIK